MTHGYGPSPQEWSGDDDPARRRPPNDPQRRVPQPPPPARNLGGTGPVPPPPPPPRRPGGPGPGAGAPSGGYPTYPTGPMPRPPMGPPTGPMPRPPMGPPTGTMPRPPMGPPTGPMPRPPLGGGPGRDRTPPPKNKSGKSTGKGKTPLKPARRRLPDLPQIKGVSLREMPQVLLKQHRNWMVGIGVIAALLVGSSCGLFSFMIVHDNRSSDDATPNAGPTVIMRDISSFNLDPTPLTVADIFPSTEIVADPSFPPYRQLGSAEESNDCRLAGSGAVSTDLQNIGGCKQYVRATFASPDGGYLITAGVFNLSDEGAATDTVNAIEGQITNGQGRLAGFVAPDDEDDTRPIYGAPARPVMQVRGHFLLYLVIVRADGNDFTADDTNNIDIIRYDLLTNYLLNTIIHNWAVDKAAMASLSAAASAAAASPTP